MLLKVVVKLKNDVWIPEDVYHAAMLGTAQIWLANDALIVIRAAEDEFTREPIMFIWAAYSSNGDALVEYCEDVEIIARNMGAAKIQFMTPREGMEKRLQRLPGWHRGNTLFEKEIL